MSKRKSALNSRKGGGKQTASKGAKPDTAGKTEAGTSRRTTAALGAKVKKNATASGPGTAEKRHAGIGRS